MKILQINAVNKYSSTGRTTFELDEMLKTKGHESYIAFSETIVKNDKGYKIGKKFGKKLHALLSRIFGLQAYFSSHSTMHLLKFIKSIKPDVVHLRNLHANYINLGILLSFLSENKIPVVITLHDCWFFTGGCMYYSKVDCNRWQSKCGHCPFVRKSSMSWFFDTTSKVLRDKKKLLEKNKVAVIGVSGWITDEAKHSILKDALIFKCIYNWIDLDVFAPRDVSSLREKLGLKDKFVILGVSQKWTSNKGISTFIDISMLDDNFSIVLVGALDENIVLPKNIISVGTTNNTAELAEYYCLADVLFNPSVQETFGKVTAEAMACGTPVIGSNSTATPELIGHDGSCGYVVDKDNLSEVIEKINLVRENKKQHYSANCRKRAEELFDKEKNIDQYIDVYSQLIN